MFERFTNYFQRRNQGSYDREFRELVDLVKESMPTMSGMRSLAADDHGWNVFSDTDDDDLQQAVRGRNVRNARICWHRDPMAKQATRLWTDYALGASGAKFKAKDQRIDTLLQAVWKARQNQVVFGYQGQRKSSTRLLVDGEIFFVLFGEGPETIIRRIPDPLQVTRIIFDPEDGERPLYYRRDYTIGNKTVTSYYRASSLQPDDDIPDVKDDGKNVSSLAETDACILHVAFDPFATRGNGLLSTVTDWTHEHWEFMSSRVAIIKALSHFAWKLKAKGGSKAMEDLRRTAENRTPFNADGTRKRPGDTWMENQNVDLTAFPRDTGAGNAKSDGDQLKLMICAGTGIMQHYFGDPSTGNLATATAMELPMLKQFEAYQQLWAGAYMEIFQHVTGEYEDNLDVDIDFPPIITRETSAYADSVTKYDQVIPGLAESRSVLMQILMTLGINNVEDEVEDILKRAEERRAETKKQEDLALKSQAAAAKKEPTKTGPNQATESLIEALQSLRNEL